MDSGSMWTRPTRACCDHSWSSGVTQPDHQAPETQSLSTSTRSRPSPIVWITLVAASLRLARSGQNRGDSPSASSQALWIDWKHPVHRSIWRSSWMVRSQMAIDALRSCTSARRYQRSGAGRRTQSHTSPSAMRVTVRSSSNTTWLRDGIRRVSGRSARAIASFAGSAAAVGAWMARPRRAPRPRLARAGR